MSPFVVVYSTSLHTWEVWQAGRPVGHYGTLESCLAAYPTALPVSERQRHIALRDQLTIGTPCPDPSVSPSPSPSTSARSS